jgi:adenosylmethionine-8-amino-7-oxononanoate aminotransferase
MSNDTTTHLSPAELLVARFGGVRPLARVIDKHPSIVMRWKTPVERGGGGGIVPVKLMPRILEIAQEKGVKLTADELIRGGVA